MIQINLPGFGGGSKAPESASARARRIEAERMDPQSDFNRRRRRAMFIDDSDGGDMDEGFGGGGEESSGGMGGSPDSDQADT